MQKLHAEGKMNMKPRYKILLATLIMVPLAVIFVSVAARMQDMDKQQMPAATAELHLVIRKKDRVLEVYEAGRMSKSYTVVLGFSPEGDKGKEGDGRTPEGDFYVFTRNEKSRFHLSLGLSYPSKDDAIRGLADGVITKAEHDEIFKAIDAGKMPPQKTALGGEIYIHGGGVDGDWTWGCVAMKNEEVEELFRSIPVGTRVTIRP